MPKTKEQFEQIRNERINTILESALTLFAYKGYDAVNLDEVTKEANCSHGLLYHYFKGKEELYQAVLERIVYPKSSEAFINVDRNQKAKFVIQDMLEVTIKLFKSPNDENAQILYLLLNTHLQKSLKVIKKTESGHTYLFSWAEEMIEKGKQEGDFKDYSTNELAIALLSLLKGLAFNRMHIGYKRFICPRSEIMMGILLK